MPENKIPKEYFPFHGTGKFNHVAAFSIRRFGNMSLNYADTRKSLDNRKLFLNNLGVDYKNLVCAKQVHADNIRLVTEKEKGRGAFNYDGSFPATDGFITNIKKLPLAVFTADCLSVFLYDCTIPAVGLVHAGWRGSKGRILSQAIRLMQDKFNTKIKNLLVSFGPAIRSCCYEVGKELEIYFPGKLINRKERYYLDLAEINKEELQELGVEKKNIFDPGICTFCDNRNFFSYRKEGKGCGRIISVIMLQ